MVVCKICGLEYLFACGEENHLQGVNCAAGYDYYPADTISCWYGSDLDGDIYQLVGPPEITTKYHVDPICDTCLFIALAEGVLVKINVEDYEYHPADINYDPKAAVRRLLPPERPPEPLQQLQLLNRATIRSMLTGLVGAIMPICPPGELRSVMRELAICDDFWDRVNVMLGMLPEIAEALIPECSDQVMAMIPDKRPDLHVVPSID